MSLQTIRDPSIIFSDFAKISPLYVVFADNNSKYYVKNGKTGAIEYSDIDASKVIQYAINQIANMGGGTIVLKGEFYFPTFTAPSSIGSALISIPSSIRLRITGDEAILHLPQNNYTDQMWLFTVANQSLDTGVGRVTFENLYIIDDVNTSSYSSNFLVTHSKGVIAEVRNCVFRFNQLGGYGIWLNNGLGARISGCRFLEIGGRTAVLFDSVSIGKVSDSLFIARAYGRIGIAISVGTGNIIVENSEFYGMDTVFHFSDVDGETTLSASNNIFGVERRYYFAMPDSSSWIMFPLRLIYINNVSNFRINIDNSYITSEIFICGNTPTGRIVDVYVNNSIVRTSIASCVHQNTDGYPIINLHFNHCQFGISDYSSYPVNFISGSYDWSASKPNAPVNFYVKNSVLYTSIRYDYYYLASLNNHSAYNPVSAEFIFENNIIYVKNTSSTNYHYSLVDAGAEKAINLSITARFRNNKIVLNGPITLVLGNNLYTSNSAYTSLDLLMYNNEIIYQNGASFGAEINGIGNYTRTMIKRNIGYTTENGGTVTFNGDGITTQFKIAHGLISTPSKVLVTPASSDATGSFYVTVDATYIYVNYTTAPLSGTNNVVLNWYAEV